MKARPIPAIPANELLHYGVWEFDMDEENYSDEQDETWVLPVLHLPVDDLSNRIVVTKLKLANNQEVVGMMDNIELNNIESTKVFIGVSVEKEGGWFHLERYFDALYDKYGPSQLAEFLGLQIDQVFPISYDISLLATGNVNVIKGIIPAEPEQRLSFDERRKL